MEYRCEWCGKPHAEDDPPCDNCGHGSFERAVVPAAPEGDADGPAVWVCTDCGREHPRNNPPCSRCNGMDFERRTQTFDDGAVPGVDDGEERPDADPAVGASDTTVVWACSECGRGHTRNNPPCSRCGNMQLERREERFEGTDVGGGGYLDVVDRTIVGGFVVALVLGVVVVGGALGVVPVPGLGPSLPDAPGEATEYRGLALADVEDEYVAELDDRTGADLERDADLDEMATYYNRRAVRAAYGEGSTASEGEMAERFDLPGRCGEGAYFHDATLAPSATEGSFGSAADLGTRLADSVLDGGYEPTAPAGYVGVDVHVGPDGDVFVTTFTC